MIPIGSPQKEKPPLDRVATPSGQDEGSYKVYWVLGVAELSSEGNEEIPA